MHRFVLFASILQVYRENTETAGRGEQRGDNGAAGLIAAGNDAEFR